MNPTSPNFKVIRLDGFSPSWIGSHPFQPGFAVGSESGKAAFTDESGAETIARYALSDSNESINGIAGFGDYLAASTRHDVAIFAFSRGPNGHVHSAIIPRGSHGIIASTESAQFLAPIGHDGLLVVTPTPAAISQHRINTFPGTLANFYRLCELPASENRLHFIAACRSAGVGILDISKVSGETGLVVGQFPADIVDVAYLAPAPVNGTTVDISAERLPAEIRFGDAALIGKRRQLDSAAQGDARVTRRPCPAKIVSLSVNLKRLYQFERSPSGNT